MSKQKTKEPRTITVLKPDIEIEAIMDMIIEIRGKGV